MARHFLPLAKATGKADLQAVRDFLVKVQANVVNMDQSGRQSMANFAERDGRRGCHVRRRDSAAQPGRGQGTDSIRDSAGDAVDRGAGGGSRSIGGITWESRGGSGVPRIPGVRPRAADLCEVRVSAGEIRSRSARRGECSAAEALHDGRPGGWAKIEKELYGSKGLWTSIFTAEASAMRSASERQWLQPH